MIAAVRVLDMIAIYKKNGVSAVCDITPGLLDSFYIDPAFDAELYKESAEPAVVPTESDSKTAATGQLDTFDSESYRPVYSMPMPSSAAAMALKKAGSARLIETSAKKSPELNPFIVDESLAAEWAELFENNEVSAKSATSTPSLPGNLPPPPGFTDESPNTQSKLSPPPGLAPRQVTYESRLAVDESHEQLKEAAVPVAEYRHLVLQPRSVPMPPPQSISSPPSHSKH